MNRKTCCASIITYNPNIFNLINNIKQIKKDIENVLVIDNNSLNFNEIVYELKKYDIECEVLKNNVNYGVGKALNQALDWALDNNYEWLVTFDQDSTCENKFFEKLFSFDQSDTKIAMIYPQIHIIETTSHAAKNNVFLSSIFKNIKKILKLDLEMPITSGAMMNVNILKELGGYDNDMFIDGIDFDVDIKIHKSGHKMIKKRKAVLHHCIGSPRATSKYIFSISASGHSPLRCFYMNRNAWVLFYKHHDFCLIWLIWNILRVWVMSLRNALLMENFIEYFKAGFKGQYAGIKKINDLMF